MNIPEEAVAAAAFALGVRSGLTEGQVAHRINHDHDVAWGWFQDARAALSAAAPSLMAMAREVVDSVREVDALPIGSVVLDADRTTWTKAGDEELDWWERPTDEMGYGNSDIELPATILYMPKEQP